jgi:selenocysteine lyase/cysteine desulfurase
MSNGRFAGGYETLAAQLAQMRPVVFVGPYEHHSNEVSWRECFAEVVEIELTAEGLRDLQDLRAKVSREQYRGRILHEPGALAFFDYAAIAPYEPICPRRSERAGRWTSSTSTRCERSPELPRSCRPCVRRWPWS